MEEHNHTSSLNSGLEPDSSLDIWRYLHILYIHKWLFLVVFVISVLVAYFYQTTRKQEMYSASVDVFYVEFSKDVFLPFDFTTMRGTTFRSSNFDRNFWLSVMRSREAMRRTIEYSKLPLFSEDSKWGIHVEIKKDKKDNSVSSFAEAPVYTVNIFSTQSEYIPKIANAFLKTINELLVKYQVENSKTMVFFISRQLEDNYKKLGEIDMTIMQNQSSNPFLARDIRKMVTDIEVFRTALLNAQIELSSVSAAKRKTEAEINVLDGTIVTESSFSEPMKVQLMNLYVDLARALTRNTEDHPSVMAIRDNIQQLNNMLRDGVEQRLEISSLAVDPVKQQLTMRFLEQSISEISLQAKIQSLQQVIAELEGQVVPDTSNTHYHQLARNREMILLTINQLNARLIETQSVAHGGLNSFVIIDEPEKPVMPNKKNPYLAVIISLLIGITLGVGAVVLYDLIDNRIQLIKDYEKFYTYPVIGAVAPTKGEKISDVLNEMKSRDEWRNDEFASISVNVLQSLRKSSSKTIAICSAVRSEGKSLTSLKLAGYLAENKKKVLLVDFDIFDPGISPELLNGKEGIIEFSTGKCDITDIVEPTEIPNLHFVGSGSFNSTVTKSFDFNDEVIKDFLVWAESNYDVVVIDTPAVLFIPDISFLLDNVGIIIPIVRLQYSCRRCLDSMFKLIRPNKQKIIGVIVRNVKHYRFGNYTNYHYYSYSKSYNNDQKSS